MGAIFAADSHGASVEHNVSPSLTPGGTAGGPAVPASVAAVGDNQGFGGGLPTGGSGGARTTSNNGIVGEAGPSPFASGTSAGAK